MNGTEYIGTEDNRSYNEILFEQFVICAVIQDNVRYNIFYQISQLNKEFYKLTYNILKKYRFLYYKHAPEVARCYARKLISHPIKYTGVATRVIPVPNLMNSPLGLAFLDSDLPIFDDNFLNTKLAALTNLCIIMRNKIGFCYTISFGETIISMGWVRPDEITELPPYELEDIDKIRNRLGLERDDPALNPLDPRGPPGRFFVDLNLDIRNNPLLLSLNTISPRRLYIAINYIAHVREINHVDEIYVCHNVNYVIYGFSHIIAQFRTASIDSVDISTLGVFCGEVNSHVRKFSIVQKIEKIEARIFAADALEYVGMMSADDLLSGFADPDIDMIPDLVNEPTYEPHPDYTSSDEY